jgi:hypothetical protein
MTRAEVYQLLGQWDLECNVWLSAEGDVQVETSFREDRVVAVSGDQLEVGDQVLRAGDSQERWQRVLGRLARSEHFPGPNERASCASGITTSHMYPRLDVAVVQGWHPERGGARCFRVGRLED